MLFLDIKIFWIEGWGYRKFDDDAWKCAKMPIFSQKIYQKIEQMFILVVHTN